MSMSRSRATLMLGSVSVLLVTLRWTFDERIEDGLFAARSADWLRRRIEGPFRCLGAPEAAATGSRERHHAAG
jgi:hypothetical protein